MSSFPICLTETRNILVSPMSLASSNHNTSAQIGHQPHGHSYTRHTYASSFYSFLILFLSLYIICQTNVFTLSAAHSYSISSTPVSSFQIYQPSLSPPSPSLRIKYASDLFADVTNTLTPLVEWLQQSSYVRPADGKSIVWTDRPSQISSIAWGLQHHVTPQTQTQTLSNMAKVYNHPSNSPPSASNTLHAERTATSILSAPKPLRVIPIGNTSWVFVIPDKFSLIDTYTAICPMLNQTRDQGNCLSDHTVSVASALSDRFCLHSNGQININLSSQDPLSCCKWSCGFGCNGGFGWSAWNYAYQQGIVTGGEYNSQQGCLPFQLPSCSYYNATSGVSTACVSEDGVNTPTCPYACQENYRRKWKDDKYFSQQPYIVTNQTSNSSILLNSHTNYPTYIPLLENQTMLILTPYLPTNVSLTQVEAMQLEIMLHGSVTNSMILYHDFASNIQTQPSQVYAPTRYSVVDGTVNVKIVGWSNVVYVDYWQAVNSWNATWGLNGSFRIFRGSNIGNIETNVIGAVPDYGRSPKN